MSLLIIDKRAEDSIVEFDNAASTGLVASAVPINIGAVEGWGVESLFQARPINNRNFRLDLTTTHSYQTNEVTDMGDAQPIFGSRDVNVIKEGLSKHAYYHFKVLGAKFDENGEYDGVLAEAERSYLGTPNPPYTGSFSLNATLSRNLNINMLAEWATGLSILNYSKRQAVRYSNTPGQMEWEDALGMEDWFPDRGPAPVGSQEYINAANNFARLSRSHKANFVEDADWFKLREVSISYSLTSALRNMLKNSLLSDVVVGFSARNLWMTTKYSGPDIELNYSGARSANRGVDFYSLQVPRVFNFWFRISI